MKILLALTFISLNSWSAPSDYGCDKTIFIKEKIVIIGGCTNQSCSVKTQDPNSKSVLNKRVIKLEDAFVGDDVSILNEKCAPSGYDLYLANSTKTGQKVLSPEEWHKKIESNKVKYSQGRRFVAEPE